MHTAARAPFFDTTPTTPCLKGAKEAYGNLGLKLCERPCESPSGALKNNEIQRFSRMCHSVAHFRTKVEANQLEQKWAVSTESYHKTCVAHNESQ